MKGIAATKLGNETQVFGSWGTITLSNGDEKLWFAKAGDKGFTEIAETDPQMRLPGLNKGIWNVSVVSALSELVATISEGREMRRGATFLDSLRNQLVLDAIIASTKSRRWETLDMEAVV